MITDTTKTAADVANLLKALGVDAKSYTGGSLAVHSPVTGDRIADVVETSAADARKAIDAAHKAFLDWRVIPAPKRGELVRLAKPFDARLLASALERTLSGIGRSAARRPAEAAQAVTDIGKNVLDPAKRADAARSGRRQAAGVVDQVRAVWEG